MLPRKYARYFQSCVRATCQPCRLHISWTMDKPSSLPLLPAHIPKIFWIISQDWAAVLLSVLCLWVIIIHLAIYIALCDQWHAQGRENVTYTSRKWVMHLAKSRSCAIWHKIMLVIYNAGIISSICLPAILVWKRKLWFITMLNESNHV